MKGYIKGKTVILLEELPDNLQEGDEVNILIFPNKQTHKQQFDLGIITTNNDKKFDRPGLHLGAISTSDDFDEPLPDEFWLGEA